MGSHPPGAWGDDDGLRWYTFDEQDYLSVTSQRKVLGMPYRLHAWVLKQMALGIHLNPDDARLQPGENVEDVIRRLKSHATKERDAKAERGTAVHELVAKGTPMRDCPEDLQPFVEQYSKAVIALGMRVLLAERQVFSKRYRYAGSFDALAYLRKYDKTAVVDLKTGSGTYPEHAIQSLSYLRADFVATPDISGIDEEATRLLHAATGIGILHIQPDGWEYHDLVITPRLEQAFKAQCVLAQFYARTKDIRDLEAA